MQSSDSESSENDSRSGKKCNKNKSVRKHYKVDSDSSETEEDVKLEKQKRPKHRRRNGSAESSESDRKAGKHMKKSKWVRKHNIKAESSDSEKEVKTEKQKRLKNRKRRSESESSQEEKKVSKGKKYDKKRTNEDGISSGDDQRSMRRSDMKSLRKAWRPQLKFTGQYGKTDSWSEFTSLKRLIDQAVAKDPPYEDDEIIEATIRSITAGTELRKFLEGTPGLTLELLMESLRSFYMEPEEKDLIHDLSNLKQGNDEDPQRFVMRGIDIYHQFNVKEKRRMSESMAFELLLEGLETGFTSENIRIRMRPYLEEPQNI